MVDTQVIRTSGAAALRKVNPFVRPEDERAGERHAARIRARTRFLRIGFVALVMLPTVSSAFYYGLWATDRYVSEAQFIVRGVSSNRATGLDSLFRTFGIARTVDDANAVENYLMSRDAVRGLEAALPLREMFSRANADYFSRFPRFWGGESFERLYWYYQDRVKVIPNPEKGITTLEVQAFRPDDAQKIAQQLLSMAEAFVNKMNERAQSDAVRSAEIEVREATAKVLAAQNDLTSFRNAGLVVDPSKNSIAQLETMTQLSVDLDHTLAQLSESLKLSTSSPSIPVLKAHADALTARIVAERGKLAGTEQGLATQVSAFEQLTMLRDLTEKSLSASVIALETARQEARRQQIYIEKVIEPNLADESTQPQRIRSVAMVFMVSFSLLAVGWILTVGVKEHRH
jgi:capsular polysaccharide transport system permease protein